MSRFMRTSILIILVLLLGFSILTRAEGFYWVEQVELSDGTLINIQRGAEMTRGVGELSQLAHKWPNYYSLSFFYPYTSEKVEWKGVYGFNPILLSFSGNDSYLVILQFNVFADLKQYGCPEIPYVFFRYNRSKKSWTQVAAADFPAILNRANLAVDYSTNAHQGKTFTAEEVIQRNRRAEREGYFKSAIPRDFASWQNRTKNQYRVSHYKDGCRDRVPSNEDQTHPQSRGQQSQEAHVETMETKVFTPDWIVKGDQQNQSEKWNAIAWNPEREKRCKALVRRVGDDTDKPELRGWLLFVGDQTGTKKARDTGQIFCSTDAIWFFDYAVEPSYTVVSKFSTMGDFIYRAHFKTPDSLSGFPGGILQPTFRAEDGYLYFEWWNTDQSGWDRHIKRILKLRMLEPSALKG